MSFGNDYLEFLKKKQKEENIAPIGNGVLDALKSGKDDDIAPTKEEDTWFKGSSLFDDGYDVGDVSRTVLSSAGDLLENAVGGLLEMGEGVVDAGAYVVGGAADLFGADEFSDNVKDFIADDLYDGVGFAKNVGDAIDFLDVFDTEEQSVFGTKSDFLAQSAGQLAGVVALQAVGVPAWVTMGVTSFGGEVENAFNQGATYGQAGLSGLITAGAEILTERISGGISFGGKTLDSALTQSLALGISNKTVRTLAKLGVDMAGEGFEEVLSGALSAVGQKLTYNKDKEFSEIFSSEDAFDSFIGGAVLGFGSSSVNAVKSAKNGVDATTGLTKSEESVFKKVYESELKAEAEKKGEDLTKKEKDKIYDKVMKDLEKGYVSTDTIEEVLGGEDYANYKNELKHQESLDNELKELSNIKKSDLTTAQEDRIAELKGMKPNTEMVDSLKFSIDENIRNALETDKTNLKNRNSFLAESYNEKARRGQAFEADLSKYDTKQQAIIKKAVDSGILNNTNKTHDFVDMVAKISADKGVTFDFTNNEKLKESGFGINGKFVNGYYNNGGITVNMNSAKTLDTVVGHEITHVLEGTELYNALQKTIIEYAKTKGDYQGRLDTLKKLYEGVKDADINEELTADLVGDYLFTDEDFVRHLSTSNRNVFEKIFDEIKYLCKIATAGSKEARQLEEVKHIFEKVWRESNTNKVDGVKYSISTENIPMVKTTYTTKPTEAGLQKNLKTVREVRTDTMLKNGYTEADVKEVNHFMDNLAKFMEKAGITYKYIGLEDVNNAKLKVTYDKNGNPKKVTVSAMVKNGEYPVNFDFTRICKKRQSMSMVIKELAKRQTIDGRRTIDTINLDAKALWAINEELRKAGLETACLGCFVESKRYNIQAFSDKATKMWNSIVDEVRRENGADGEAEYFNFAEGIDLDTVDYGTIEKIFADYNTVKGRTSPEARMRALIRNGGELYQRYLQSSDLMTPEGIEAIKAMSTKKNDFYGILKGVYGQAAPKEVMGFSPYNSEIALLPNKMKGKKLAEYVASIGGVRMQSFSDFLVANTYDYMQMVADLSAKHLPAHAYTKEIAFAKIFGMTGIKINMSVMFDIDANLPNEYAGLQFIADPNGDEVVNGVRGYLDYLVGDKKRSDAVYEVTGERPYVQSIDFDEAVALQNDPRYSKNCGIIGVGMSDKHIIKMLGDGRIRYIIPYHSSSLPSIIAEVTNIKKATDYTKSQNTRKITSIVDANGDAIDIKSLRNQCNSWSEVYTLIQENVTNEGWQVQTESDGALAGRGEFDVYKDLEKTNDPKQTAENYLQYCGENNYMPIFEQFAFHENYYKLLYDFDVYDTVTGEYAPQTEVKNIYDGYNVEEGLTSTETVEKMIDEEMAKQNEINKSRNEAMPSVVDNVLDHLGVEHDKVDVGTQESVDTQEEVVGDDIAPTDYSLSNEGESPTQKGRFYGKDMLLQGDIAPVRENTTTTSSPKVDNISDETAPVEEDVPAPITTVKERIEAKLANVEQEILNNRQLRADSFTDFTREIERLQKEYSAKKNKNTKVSNDILRRIERLQTMRNNVDADYEKRINDLTTKAEKMKTPAYQTAMQRQAKTQEYTEWVENLIGDTTTWVDKKLGISYKTNTLKRNLRDVVRDAQGNRDIAKADAIYDELQGTYNHNEAELNRESNRIKKVFADMKITSAEDAYIQMLGEFKYNPETTLKAEDVNKFYEANKAKIDIDKVNNAIELARKNYDDLLERVNEVLREQGMKEIPYRKGYFPHFTEEKQGLLAKLFNWKTQNTEIPTSIAGLTEQFTPNRSWQSFNKQRFTDATDYSFTKGFDTYVQGALDWAYHIEDIQKRRAFENELRYIHSEQGVQDKIQALFNNEEYDADELQEQIDLIYAEARNPLNNFVTDLRAGTNKLANKKSSMDRGMEEMTNRKFYSTMTNLSNRVSANMVGGSVSSALTNFIPITQSWGEVSPVSSLKAMGETLKATYRDDGVVDKSDFLTNRLKKADNLYKTNWDKISNGLGAMMEGIDSFTSQTVWRSKYLENISKGMSENEAIKNADQFAEGVMAGRSRGNQPTLFDSKNPLIKTLTAFQLEVNNQYGYMFKDMPQDMKNESTSKLVKGYAAMFIGAYAYNALYSALTGRDAAFDPIGIIQELLGDLFDEDEEEAPIDAALGFAENVAQEIPFVGGLLGGGRVPISSALPYDGNIMDLFEGTANAFAGENVEAATKEWLKPLYYLAMPIGGGQLKKTIQGLSMFSDEHPIAGSYTDSGNLRFPVEDTTLNRVQAGIFGQYASQNAQDYFDNDIAPLDEKQTQEFIDVNKTGMSIQDYWSYRKGLSGLKTLAEKADYINGLGLTNEQKNVLINNIADRKEDIDMSDYGNYGSFEEFDFANKYPEKHAIAQSVGGYDAYKTYTGALNDIKADKDSNGKTISGSRKTKVANYINSLNADYGTKIILFKSEYPSDNTYNHDIIDYLNNRNDISYEQMKTILIELGFYVDSKGNVTWN